MPAEFDACVKNGGQVRTINPKPGMYMHICRIHGHTDPGEMRMKKGMDTKGKHGTGK